jgi:DNA-binding NtrC family response regulator
MSKCLKIFYIDDEIELCENFSDEFSSESVQINTFTDPQCAIELAQINPPDLLFIDFRLPGTNGELMAQRFDPSIPKFLVTGEITNINVTCFRDVFRKPLQRLKVLEVISILSKNGTYSS